MVPPRLVSRLLGTTVRRTGDPRSILRDFSRTQTQTPSRPRNRRSRTDRIVPMIELTPDPSLPYRGVSMRQIAQDERHHRGDLGSQADHTVLSLRPLAFDTDQ